MSPLNDKQVLIATVSVPVLCVAGFGWLAWSDWQRVYRNEVSEENPAASEVTDAELWGEKRKAQEVQKQIDQLRGEADLIGKREQDVIVYREIVQRDAQLLPDRDQVNKLAETIDEFQNQSGVQLTRVSDLNPGQGEGAIRRMPIRLSVAGSFDQFLKFLNLFETMDRIVNVRGFTIAAGPAPTDPNSVPAHGIQLELETYIYNGSAGLAKPVDIANYDRRKDDPVIQKLIRQQRAARIEKYQLKPRINRRDPLVDPRRTQTQDDTPVGPEEEANQKATLEKLKIDITLLNEDVRLLQQYVQEKKYVQLVQLKALIQEKIGGLDLAIRDGDKKLTIAALREAYQDEVVQPFMRIKEQAPTDIGPVVMGRKEIAQFLEPMKQADEAAEYEKVLDNMKRFDEWTKDKTIMEDAQDLVVAMRDLARKAKVQLDFEAIKIVVSGIIRRPEGSIVLLNKKACKVGDAIDDAMRCRLLRIEDDALIFDFEGFEIRWPLKK